jgi:hemolysin-activating ACP:hemolysin acyltransferase
MAFFSSKSKPDGQSSNSSNDKQASATEQDLPSSPPQQASDSGAAQQPPPATGAPQGNVGQQAELPPEEARKRAAISKQLAAAFGELVTLIMRSETDRQRPISDLAWMIGPGVQTGQFAIADAQSKTNGSVTPVGAILWALVSEEVDQRLSANAAESPRLEAKDWRSGDIPWIVVAIGDNRVIAGLIRQISKDVLKGVAPKIRSRDKDGNVVVSRIELPAEEKPGETPQA